MNGVRRLLFTRPDGGHTMVLERDRALFEARGFVYVGPYDDEEPVAIMAAIAPEAPPLAVQSRALERTRRTKP